MTVEQKKLKDAKQLENVYYDFIPLEKEVCEYSEILESYIRKSCKSIGLIGGYATGKSSIIKTYMQKNEEVECIIISSATFKKQNIHEISYIQKVFITQLLAELGEDYYIDKNYRLKKRNKLTGKYKQNKIFEFYMMSLLYLILSFFDFGLHSEVLILIKILLLLFVIPYTTKLILEVINDTNITKSFSNISIKDLKIEVDDSNLILEDHITKDMHIITVLIQELKKQKEGKLVIFIEDIDRYLQNDIFNSLYHINKVVEKLDVHFVYALGTDIGIEDMTKYFDAIIDVIPFYDQYNASQHVNLLLDHPLDAKFLNKILYYIDDYRLTKRIVNLYKFYEKNYPSKEREVMFCLATLKIKFPNYLVVTPGIQDIEADHLKVIVDEVYKVTLDNNQRDFQQIFSSIVNAEIGYEDDKNEVRRLLDAASNRNKTNESLNKIQDNYKRMKENLKTDYNLIEFMILEGYLDEKYNWYMSVSSNSYSSKDQDFISSLLNKDGTFNLSHNVDSLNMIYDNYITTQNIKSEVMLLTQQFFDFIMNIEIKQIDNLIDNMILNKKVIEVFFKIKP